MKGFLLPWAVVFCCLCCIRCSRVPAGLDLRMMSYNVHNAVGMDEVADYKRIADVVLRGSPDVVAFQELDSATARSNGVYVLHEIAKNARMHGVFGASIDYRGGKYGLGVMSKEKPLLHYSVVLPGREEQRQLLVVEFEKYVIGCTHLSLTPEDRLASVPMICREAAKFSKPFFLAGDWNAKPESDALTEIQKCFTLLSSPEMPTYPSENPNICIDYIAYFDGGSKDAPKVSVRSQKVMDEKVASDHCPVWVDIRMEKPGAK